jgi:hypothetical protein
MNIAFADNQQQILESPQVNIKEVFYRYIGKEIQKNGFCKCPFHSEKTASFMLFEKNNSFYCFGCGVGGNVINLVSKALNISYLEAMKRLDVDYHLGIFQTVIKTDIQRSKEAVKIAREKLKHEQLQQKRKENYFKLTNFYKELREMPSNKVVSHHLAHIERLLDKWLLYDYKPFDRVPDDFDADALIEALKTKFTEEEVENEHRN